MALIHHVAKGSGSQPFMFVHGFACSHCDYDAQVRDLSSRHATVAVDLRGHGQSKAPPDQCSIERFGADVAEVLHALDLKGAIVVGHSMGCRVALEAALQAPSRVGGLVLVDGSQFNPAMQPVITERFAKGEFLQVAEGMFKEMFTSKSDPATVASVVARAKALPAEIGTKVLLDLIRYDLTRLESSLTQVKVPLMALQSTFSNEKRQRSTMTKGQTTPYLDLVRSKIPAARIEIVENTGHFPQLDEPAATTALLADFAAKLV